MRFMCKNCDGRGHILNKPLMLLPPMWLIALFEKNKVNGITREKCCQCDGYGFIRIGADNDE